MSVVRLALLLAVLSCPALASEPFPFDTQLVLDAAPMRGSKRIPMLQIDDDGTAQIDLWCASLRGKATIGDDSIAIVPDAAAAPTAAPCDPDRAATDAALLATLSQMTKWRWAGDVIELSGPPALRFRLMTN